jgi:carbamoyl-phosphate synthase small subunit
MNKQSDIKLILEDGKEFYGYAFGFPKSVSGEVVFNTAMTGYPESLTDPSYKGQILALTYPIIGNYGVPGNLTEDSMYKFFESYALHITGLIISDYTHEYSHWNADKSLGAWLQDSNIPGIFGIDTRELTKILREEGTMLGKIVYDNNDIDLYDPNCENLVEQVSIREKKIFGHGRNRILLIDCGVKYNIIRNLLQRDTTVVLVPWDYDISVKLMTDFSYPTDREIRNSAKPPLTICARPCRKKSPYMAYVWEISYWPLPPAPILTSSNTGTGAIISLFC